jgi:hypothetical protein
MWVPGNDLTSHCNPPFADSVLTESGKIHVQVVFTKVLVPRVPCRTAQEWGNRWTELTFSNNSEEDKHLGLSQKAWETGSYGHEKLRINEKPDPN